MGRGITLKDGDPDTGNELHDASRKGELQEVKRLTEEEQLDPLGVNKKGLNALHCAALAGHLDVLKYFIEDRGCNAACVDQRGATPLHCAAQFKHLNIIQYLVEKQQVEPSSRVSGYTALHFACAGGSIDVIHYLAKEMSKYLPLKEVVEDQAHRGVRPLHVAAMFGHLEAVKFMITELNSDPNATTNVGVNALHFAISGGHLEVVRNLTEYHQQHCDPSCRSTIDPRRPGWHSRAFLLNLANVKGHHHIIEYLESISDS